MNYDDNLELTSQKIHEPVKKNVEEDAVETMKNINAKNKEEKGNKDMKMKNETVDTGKVVEKKTGVKSGKKNSSIKKELESADKKLGEFNDILVPGDATYTLGGFMGLSGQGLNQFNKSISRQQLENYVVGVPYYGVGELPETLLNLTINKTINIEFDKLENLKHTLGKMYVQKMVIEMVI